MKVTAQDVKKLRDKTGAGMMDCKKALVEAEGDFEKAIDILRKKGQKIMGKRADRNATEGVVIALTDGKKGISINLSAETDFVALTDDFIDLAKKIAAAALAHFPADKDALNALPLGDDTDDTVGESTLSMAGVIGEKIEVKKYDRIEAEEVAAYIHAGYKVGVLVGLNKAGETSAEAGKNLAMQIAALSPIAIDKGDIPQEAIEKERELLMEMALKEHAGKSEKMVQNIVNGQLNKLFFKDKTLMNQDYVKGNKTSVRDYLKSVDKDLKVTGFRRMDLV